MRVGILLFCGTTALLVAALAAAEPADNGRWSFGPRLSTARSEIAVAATGGVLYVIAGYAEGNPSQPLVDAFDPRTGRWQRRAALPRGLNHVGAAALGGKIYVIGGFERSNRDAVADCFVYDPARNRWQAIAPLPRKRGSVSLAALGGKLHAVGGRDEESVMTHEVYDPAANRWTSAAPLPPGEGRDHMGLVAEGGKLYALGGRFNDFYHNTDIAEAYDPRSDRWSELPRLPTARSGGAAAVYRGRILYIGGERAGGVFTENEAFDPASSSWSELTPVPSGRHGTGAAVIGEKLYLPAGAPVNGGSRQSDTLLVFVMK